MTRPMMQKPKRPAMEACICCGMAPPATSAPREVVALGRAAEKWTAAKH